MIPFSHGSANGPHGSATGFFGKLPSHGDFVRWNVVGSAVTAVERWFEQGFRAVAASGGGQMIGRCQATCFLMTPSQGGENVLGLVRAGVDRTGREYPFVVFRILPGHGSGYLPSEVIGSQLAFLAALGTIADAAIETLSADGVRRELATLPPGERPSRGNWRTALADRPLADVSPALHDVGVANGLQALTDGLRRRVDHLRGASSARASEELVLPAAAGTAETGALFWARAIEAVCGEERCPPLSLMWPAAPSDAADAVAIATFAGLPPTAYMSHLLDPKAHAEAAAHDPLAALLPDRVQTPRVAVLRAPSTLSGFLDSLQERRRAS